MTQQIKSFKDIGGEAPETTSFVGDQIAIKKVMGREITLLDYRIGPSKFQGIRLDMQVIFKEETVLIWTSSVNLQNQIKKHIPKEALPVTVTINEKAGAFFFT